MNSIEFWFWLGISILIVLILNYLFIIRSWLRFINEQRYRNEIYQYRHNESKQATDLSAADISSKGLNDDKKGK